MAHTAPAPRGASDSRRHRDKEATSWIVGVALILLGGIFLAQSAGYLTLTGNWWALFIYLGSAGTLVNAWRSYQARGGFDSGAAGSLVWGLVLAVVASIFAFNLAWDTWWPAILIAVGIGIVIGYAFRVPEDAAEDDDTQTAG